MSNDESDLPTAEECDKLCNEFANITKTDTALAMFFLQDRKWNLEESLSDYFLSIEGEQGCTSQDSPKKNNFQVFNLKDLKQEKADDSSNDSSSVSSEEFEDTEPNRIRIMSWNIAGLNPGHLASRAFSVCQTIMKEKPDIVFLQEVVNKNYKVIESHCNGYSLVSGAMQGLLKYEGNYFTAMLLRKKTTKYEDHEVTPFRTSVMSRSLLQVEVKVKGIPFCLMTSHLESTKKFESERLKQLKICLDTLYQVPEEKAAVFGGDLNLNDSELEKIGGLKEGYADIWEETGKRQEAQYTWDTLKNDSLEMKGRFKPRSRFDRIFYRSQHLVKAVYFELVGFEKISDIRCFPSDHWGIMTHFDVVQKN